MKGDTYYKRAYKEATSKKPNLGLTYDLLIKAHELGNPKATYAIATWYLFGKHVKKDYKKGVDLLKIAAEKNIPGAYFDLGVSFEKGKGTKKNKRQAFLSYLSGAILGDKESIYEVGRCYYYGIGTKKDKSLAERWFNGAEYWKVAP